VLSPTRDSALCGTILSGLGVDNRGAAVAGSPRGRETQDEVADVAGASTAAATLTLTAHAARGAPVGTPTGHLQHIARSSSVLLREEDGGHRPIRLSDDLAASHRGLVGAEDPLPFAQGKLILAAVSRSKTRFRSFLTSVGVGLVSNLPRGKFDALASQA
jgi:hypothetical protein